MAAFPTVGPLVRTPAEAGCPNLSSEEALGGHIGICGSGDGGGSGVGCNHMAGTGPGLALGVGDTKLDLGVGDGGGGRGGGGNAIVTTTGGVAAGVALGTRRDGGGDCGASSDARDAPLAFFGVIAGGDIATGATAAGLITAFLFGVLALGDTVTGIVVSDGTSISVGAGADVAEGASPLLEALNSSALLLGITTGTCSGGFMTLSGVAVMIAVGRTSTLVAFPFSGVACTVCGITAGRLRALGDSAFLRFPSLCGRLCFFSFFVTSPVMRELARIVTSLNRREGCPSRDSGPTTVCTSKNRGCHPRKRGRQPHITHGVEGVGDGRCGYRCPLNHDLCGLNKLPHNSAGRLRHFLWRLLQHCKSRG